MKSHALSSFWQCYEALPERVQRLARKNFDLFKSNLRHPSLGFQKMGGGEGRAARVRESEAS